jgi:hypothetical protein
MVDSFDINAGGSSAAQEDDNEGSSPPPPGGCDHISYPDPDVCIPPYPPDLNCPDIPYKNFEVTGTDPHGFDRDNDGLGCESANGGAPTPPPIKCPANLREEGGKCVPILECRTGFALDANGRCIPICNETELPEGEECFDEGDPGDPIDPPVCTPDGPPCPPCPEGVEAGWCADEDERRDFDCGDSDMANDPRCKDGEPVNGSEEIEEEEEEEEEELPEEVEGQVEGDIPSEDEVTKGEN